MAVKKSGKSGKTASKSASANSKKGTSGGYRTAKAGATKISYDRPIPPEKAKRKPKGK